MRVGLALALAVDLGETLIAGLAEVLIDGLDDALTEVLGDAFGVAVAALTTVQLAPNRVPTITKAQAMRSALFLNDPTI